MRVNFTGVLKLNIPDNYENYRWKSRKQAFVDVLQNREQHFYNKNESGEIRDFFETMAPNYKKPDGKRKMAFFNLDGKDFIATGPACKRVITLFGCEDNPELKNQKLKEIIKEEYTGDIIIDSIKGQRFDTININNEKYFKGDYKKVNANGILYLE